MKRNFSRRAIVKRGLIAATLAPAYALLARTAGAAALTPLDPNDPTAKGLAFVTDATKVSSAANPTYKPGQKCGNCMQYLGKPSDATAGCGLFAGHSVPVGGWCKAYAPKQA
jgi:hypothetical protein